MGTCSIELVSCISKSRDLVQSHEYISVVVHLDDSCGKEGVCRGGDPARQEGSFPLHQEDGEADSYDCVCYVMML